MSGFSVENIKSITRDVCDVNIPDSSGYSPLHLLVQKKGDNEKDLKALKLLLSAGADVNAKDQQDNTPLYLAVNSDRSKEIIEALLSAGADVNAKDQQDKTPLYLAVNADRSKEIIEVLLSAGADVNAKDQQDKTPLYLAVNADRSKEIIEILLSAGADVNAKDQQDNTPLYLAVNSDRSKEIIEALLSAGADVNAKDQQDKTPLYLAVNADRSKEIIEVLLSAGADVNAKDQQDKTPLYLAVNADRSKEIIEILLSAGADVNAKDKQDKTPLYLAVKFDRSKEIIEALIDGGADLVLAYTDEGSGVNGTILLHAVIPKAINGSYTYKFNNFKFSYIDAEITKLLIDKAAKIESACRNTPGCSPLLAAALFRRTDLVKLMLKHISIKEVDIDSVIKRDAVFGKFRESCYFKHFGTCGYDWNISGFTALHLSIFHSDLDMATALIEAGVDRNIKDGSGKTPLHHAIKGDKLDFLELLVKGCVENSEESKQQ